MWQVGALCELQETAFLVDNLNYASHELGYISLQGNGACHSQNWNIFASLKWVNKKPQETQN